MKKKVKITKNMRIGDIIKKYPLIVEALVEEDIHCFGCPAAQFEKLGQGLKAHGLSPTEMEKLLKKLNAIAEKEDKAKKKVRKRKSKK